jgi:hypothetical protein
VCRVPGDKVVALVADSAEEADPNKEAYLNGIFDLGAKCDDPADSLVPRREGN